MCLLSSHSFHFCLKRYSAPDLCLRLKEKIKKKEHVSQHFISYCGASIDPYPNYAVPFSHSPSVQVLFYYVRSRTVPFSPLRWAPVFFPPISLLHSALSLCSILSSLFFFPCLALHLPLDYADVIRTNIRASEKLARAGEILTELSAANVTNRNYSRPE